MVSTMLVRFATDAGIRVASGINILSGLWLVVSPWVLEYVVSDRSASLNNIAIGGMMLIIGLVRVSLPRSTPMLSAVNLVLGVWTLTSPWMYGFTMDGARVWSTVPVGVLVLLCAAASTTMAVQLQRLQRSHLA